MSREMTWLHQPQDIRRLIEHEMLLTDVTVYAGQRRPHPVWSLECSCGLFVDELLRGPKSAHVLHTLHVALATGPAVCPRCGDGKPTCNDWLDTDGFTLRLPHEVCCQVPWADDICERCELPFQLSLVEDNARRLSRMLMLGAAS